MAGRIKLIMTDLDGTLLDEDNRVPHENLLALKRAHDAGIKIMPVTGRFLDGAAHVLNDIPMVDSVVCSNGASLYSWPDRRCLYMDPLSRETAMKLIEYYDTLPCVPYVSINGSCYIDKKRFGLHFKDMVIPTPYKVTTGLSHLCDVKEQIMKAENGVEIIYVLFGSVEQKLKADEEVSGLVTAEVTGSSPAESENMSITAKKENMIPHMMEIYGIGPSEIMAFGDGENDAGMIASSGIGVAMGNAMEAAKAAAKYETLPNYESGVAYIINKYLDGDLE